MIKKNSIEVRLPYGDAMVPVSVPSKAHIRYPCELPAVSNPRKTIRHAIDRPIGSPSLISLAHQKSRPVIVINDATRPTPTKLMLEEIILDLTRAGIKKERVTVIVATGNHRPASSQEIIDMVGPSLANQLNIINHDCRDIAQLSFIGYTDYDLPIWINSHVANADLLILTGLIAPHHSAGYSGGRKSIVPGVAGLETLKIHHSFPIRPFGPAYGWLDGNPFHMQALQGARIAKVDFILNVVKNANGHIVAAVSGSLEKAHSEGVKICRESWALKLPHRYDIVITTPGGFPRDIDLQQSQKAASTAEMVLKEDGVIVLIAECRDGIGKFAQWLHEAKSPKEVIERFRKEGFTKDHSSKAFMYARALEKHQLIIFCKGIDFKYLESMFFSPARDPQEAIDLALKLKGENASILVLPQGTNFVPTIQEEHYLHFEKKDEE